MQVRAPTEAGASAGPSLFLICRNKDRERVGLNLDHHPGALVLSNGGIPGNVLSQESIHQSPYLEFLLHT